MNEHSKELCEFLLRRYYKSAALGWSLPRSLHWAKIVNSQGYWRWIRSHLGIKGRLLRNSPSHIYQTVCRFKSETPPRSRRSSGYFLGGPLIFDLDATAKYEPFSLWRIMDTASMVKDLQEVLHDRGAFKIVHVLFSGLRGIHVLVEEERNDFEPIRLNPEQGRNRTLAEYIQERYQVARSIGKWCQGWDWQVSADIWRVSRVPWTIHGSSALRAIPLEPPYSSSSFRDQLKAASPFSLERRIRIRTTRSVPLFTFIDGETYGPFRRGWATKVPIVAALHLIWLGLAKPREKGPSQAGAWFDKGWQFFFQSGARNNDMTTSTESLTAA